MLKSEATLPGEALAVMEEFEAGRGARQFDGIIRATIAGRPIFDFKTRRVHVEPARRTARTPSPGDSVIGHVESAQNAVVNVFIHRVNGRLSPGGFTAMMQTRPSQRSRGGRVALCRAGDVIRATVVSDQNAIIQLSLDGPNDGVVYAMCSVCGGSMARVDHRIKCVECGNVEERKLAPDFGSPALEE